MLSGEDAVNSNGSKSFIEGISLETIVPHASNIDIEEVLSESSSRDDALSSLLASIEQRQFLFFGVFLCYLVWYTLSLTYFQWHRRDSDRLCDITQPGGQST